MLTLYTLYILACAPAGDLTEVCRDKVMTPPVSAQACDNAKGAVLDAAEAEGVRVQLAVCAPALQDVRHGR